MGVEASQSRTAEPSRKHASSSRSAVDSGPSLEPGHLVQRLEDPICAQRYMQRIGEPGAREDTGDLSHEETP
jgi:hypothetical protein